MKAECFIFTALQCEAKPFIAHFKLKKDLNTHPFIVYFNKEIVLTITGSGKVAMAAAVAYSMAVFSKSPNPVLLNLGIAGHRSAALGQLFCANKLSDADSQRNFYPQLMTKNVCPDLPVLTVSRVENDYQQDCLYEMEACAFYEAASHFSTAELIQVFKVVSDNQHQGVEQINAKQVSFWLAETVEAVADAIENLKGLASTLSIPQLRHYEDLLQRYHFTVSSKHQLKALLQRWEVLTDKAELNICEIEFKNGKAVLQWLEKQINEQPFYL